MRTTNNLVQYESLSLIIYFFFSLSEKESEDLSSNTYFKLIDANNASDRVSRVPVNTTSVMYAGSLNKNKRKAAEPIDEKEQVKFLASHSS